LDAELPSDWTWAALAEICTVRRGASPRPAGDPRYFGGAIPWFKIGDATSAPGRYIDATEATVNELGASFSVRVPKGSLIVANSGVSLGFPRITGVEGCIHDGWLYLRDFSGVSRDYLYYFFLHITESLRAFASGTTQPNLNTDIARRLRVPVPPPAEQDLIVSVLSTLDDRIEINRRMNRTLSALTSALFESWFVDFDPVVAKRDGRTPLAVPTQARDLFPGHFEDSELGPIPQGWRTSSIGAEVTVVGGSTPSTSEPKFWNGDVCWLTPRDLSRLEDPVVLDTERHITAEGLAQISSGLLPAGTVLLSSRAPIGYLAIAEVPLAVNQGFIAMKCDKQLSRHYVLNWTRENLDEVLSRAGGTTFAEISKTAFRPIHLVVPPPRILQAFDDVVGPLHEMRVANVRESSTLAELRDTLLGPLLSGEISVKTAAKAVEAAV
jgi:type I restriction enzyme S subunit